MAPKDQLLHINKIALVGNPNVGKSSLFNQLTKTYSLVANVPYTTIAVCRASVQAQGITYEIIDTPGIISLDIESEDSLVTRSILMDEHPEIIILCIDTNNMKRSLLLAAQLIELEMPMIVCLNFLDESRQKGITILRKKLEALLGVPVVETVASEGRGIKELLKAIPRAGIPEKAKVQYSRLIEEGLDAVSQCFPPDAVPADGILLLAVMSACGMKKFIQQKYGKDILVKINNAVEKVQSRTSRDLVRIILEERSRWAEGISREITELQSTTTGRAGEILGALSRHPFWGWIILLGVMYCTYILVGKVGIDFLVPFIENNFFAPINIKIAEMIPWEPGREFLVGSYGILTTGLENAIGTVLPILTMFFIILNCLEDTGYISSLCVLTNRVFQHLGLSGKAILPIVLGFGCRTMATLTTRILESKKERIIAVFLIAFAIPCAPLLGVTLAILALLPFKAFLFFFGLLVFMEVLAGVILNRFLKTDIFPDFIMEIPPLRLPKLKNLIVKTYYRLKWFTLEAIPLFMTGSAILFFIDRLSLLSLIKKALSPFIVTFLHLPSGMVDAFLLCLLRLEAGAVMVLKLARIHELDPVQTIVSVIVMTGFIPCFANTMAIIKELGIKIAVWMLLALAASAFIVGGMVNFILRL